MATDAPGFAGVGRAPYAGVALISAAALAWEVLLTHLFAIVHWSHFAAVAISLALLGFGAGGTLVSVAGRRLAPVFAPAFAAALLLFGLLVPASFALAQALPFNPLELAWDRTQLAWLSVQFLVLSLPFLAAGSAIGMALAFHGRRLPRLYAADLLGAGAGALGVLGLLAGLSAGAAVAAVAATGVLAALTAARELRLGHRWTLAGLALLALLAAAPAWLDPHPSPYKDLSQALQAVGAVRTLEQSGIDGRYTVVDNARVPVRHAPGISLSRPAPIPAQRALFRNGNSLGAVTRFTGDLAPLAFTGSLVSALPYALLARPRVLLLEAGGGLPVLQALYHQAARIDVVEPLPGRGRLLAGPLAAFSGDLYRRTDVVWRAGGPRHVLDAWSGPLDLVLLDRTVGGGLAVPGLRAREADWVVTRQGLGAALARLAPGGLLAVAHWLQLPPRASLRLFNTALAALRGQPGVTDPARHLVYLRGWKTGVLLAARTPFGPERLGAIRSFARERSFDVVYPAPDGCNAAVRFNRLSRPAFCAAMQRLAGDRAGAFIAADPFDIGALDDDRPFAANYTRWRQVPKLLALDAGAGFAQLDWGHALLLITLVQALPVALLLIVVPLLLARISHQPATAAAPCRPLTGFRSVRVLDVESATPARPSVAKSSQATTFHRLATHAGEICGLARRPRAPERRPRWPLAVYFAAIGIGFMLLEIAYIEQLQHFLGAPVYAVAVSLAGFLVFAGTGSALAAAVHRRLGGHAMHRVAALLILVTLVQSGVSAPLFAAAAALPPWLRGLIALAWIAPVALLLGLPLPLGMQRLAGAGLPGDAGDTAYRVAWAWGINGSASVVGAVLAGLLVIDVGFAWTLVAALSMYAIAALVPSAR